MFADVRAFLITFLFSCSQIRIARHVILSTIVPAKSSNLVFQSQIGSMAVMYPISRDMIILRSNFLASLYLCMLVLLSPPYLAVFLSQ